MAGNKNLGFLERSSSARRSEIKTSPQADGGFVLLFCTFLIVVLFAITALVFDFGRALVERHRISIASDAASIAALNVLGPGTSYNAVLSEVYSIVQFNNVLPGEILSVRCGTWSGGNFTPQAAGVCNGSSNSVQVESRRVVPTFFARLIGVADLSPRVSALAHVTGVSAGACIRPFGVESSYFNGLYSPNGIQIGQTFTVGGHQSAGNWGKIDINGNTPDDWQGNMLNDQCDPLIQLGAIFQGDTGFSQVRQVFNAIAQDQTPPPASVGMIIALTSDFPNGGSGNVTLHEFIKVDFLSHSGNGQNWQGQFRLVERNVAPPPPPGGGTAIRYLVQ